jgi:5'-3' exonuclease
MGIPYYFYNLTKTYKDIIINQLPLNPDFYAMDFNGIIHPVAATIVKENGPKENLIITKLWDKVNEYLYFIKPKNLLICVDGVAPVAKMVQQRKRRYLTVFRNKIDNVNTLWDTNAITPGTDFMNDLNNFIKNKIRYNTSSIKFQYSGSDEVGEGEHKIFHILNNVIDESIIIHGLDADLIILSLMSHKKNIYLMREIDNTYSYLNITALRKAIITELVNKWNLDQSIKDDIFSNNAKNIIESYCTICSILGNDFIPHILTINLKSNGLEKLINSTKLSITTNGLLVINNKINYKCLTDIITELAKNEDKEIFNETENYIKKRYENTELNSDLYALKNKDPIAKIIYSNISMWRFNYYKYLFNTNINNDSSIINSACKNYIKGIYWTYNYYKRFDIDHLWYYPYSYPPSIKDIANYLQANQQEEIKKIGDYVPSIVQLLVVLPKNSINLIPLKYRKYMTDIKAGLLHMYPSEYKINTYLKNHLWESCPVLPNINIEYIRALIMKN